jgi:tRNA threonylcarbamoyladenosine biosynthesis protein TsaB
MIVLTIRTDKPEAELGLFNAGQQLAYETWEAHRQLAETIHTKMETLLHDNHKDWSDVQGIVCFEGPGSFTGLRIGLTIANTLSYSLAVPIVGSRGNDWVQGGLQRLEHNDHDPLALPHYGAPVHITKPR